MTEHRALTILFADVSGSTRLFETRGDLAARQIIAAVLAALAEVTSRHGGRVVKTIGDEVMCTFPGPLNGLLAATDMHRRIKADAGFQQDNVAIRVGLHHGEALLENGDVFGDAVNVAARMADKTLARRDQIVTTASTVEGVTSVGGMRIRSLGSAWVQGKQAPLEIVDVLWQEDLAPVTTVQRVMQAGPATIARARLLLRHRGQVFELGEDATFSIGRDPASSLVVETEWVSRNHALIEWKRGHFMFADRSTNGSWIRTDPGHEVLVHRDEVHLRRLGSISLGQAHGANDADLVHFECSES